MAAVFWLLVLGAGVVTGQPWALLIAAVLLVCLVLANIPQRPAPVALMPPPRPVEAPRAEAPAADPRELKRRWREEDLRAWQEDFDRLLGA